MAVMFAILAWIVYVAKTNITKLLSLPAPSSYVDNTNCHYIQDEDDTIRGAEDVVAWKNGIVITSSLNFFDYMEHGRGGAGVGGLFAFNIQEENPRVKRLEPLGFPGEFNPLTHGLFLSNSSDRLYVVCHWGPRSTVEIFDISYAPTAAVSVSLTWFRSVNTAAWPSGGLNDVVEGRTANELYVSQYLPAPVAEHGRKDTSFSSVLTRIATIGKNLLHIKTTGVHRCTFTDNPAVPSDCVLASETKWVGANGLAIDPDRTTLFVVDFVPQTVSKLTINPSSGALELEQTIDTPYVCDNIAYVDETGAVECGAILNMTNVFFNADKPLNEQKPVPGGLLKLIPPTQGSGGEWKTELELAHDGTLLSQVSAAVHVGNRIVLGTPSAPGILICDPPNDSVNN